MPNRMVFPMQRGFELAREEINNRGDVNLTFITADDRSSVDGAKEAVRHLVGQGVSAIVGLAISTHLKEAAPIAQENKVIAFSSVSSAAGLSGIGDFIFRTSLAVNISVPSGVMETQEKLGYKKVATIYDEIDVYAKSSNEMLRTVLEAKRGRDSDRGNLPHRRYRFFPAINQYSGDGAGRTLYLRTFTRNSGNSRPNTRGRFPRRDSDYCSGFNHG